LVFSLSITLLLPLRHYYLVWISFKQFLAKNMRYPLKNDTQLKKSTHPHDSQGDSLLQIENENNGLQYGRVIENLP